MQLGSTIISLQVVPIGLWTNYGLWLSTVVLFFCEPMCLGVQFMFLTQSSRMARRSRSGIAEHNKGFLWVSLRTTLPWCLWFSILRANIFHHNIMSYLMMTLPLPLSQPSPVSHFGTKSLSSFFRLVMRGILIPWILQPWRTWRLSIQGFPPL